MGPKKIEFVFAPATVALMRRLRRFALIFVTFGAVIFVGLELLRVAADLFGSDLVFYALLGCMLGLWAWKTAGEIGGDDGAG